MRFTFATRAQEKASASRDGGAHSCHEFRMQWGHGQSGHAEEQEEEEEERRRRRREVQGTERNGTDGSASDREASSYRPNRRRGAAQTRTP